MPSPAPVAGVVGRAGARVQRPLVDGAEEDGGILGEHRLGAVAVVHVPVEHEHARAAVLVERAAGGDGDVVEQAEAHGTPRLRMVARRAESAEGRARSARRHQRVDHRHRAAGGVDGRVVGARAHQRVEIDRSAAARGQLGDRPDVLRRMHRLERRGLDLRGEHALEPQPAA